MSNTKHWNLVSFKGKTNWKIANQNFSVVFILSVDLRHYNVDISIVYSDGYSNLRTYNTTLGKSFNKAVAKINSVWNPFCEFFFNFVHRFHFNEMQTEATSLQVVKTKQHSARYPLQNILCHPCGFMGTS